MSDPLVSALPVRELVDELLRAGQTVATAESLTAGLLSAAIAGVPGASNVLRGGLVVYATDLKTTLAGVDSESLARYGAVAATTAERLAVGAASKCAADWGLALTGVAGPDEQDGHPAGTVFLGVAGPADTEVMQLQLAGDRWGIRLAAVHAAVSELVTRLRNQAGR